MTLADKKAQIYRLIKLGMDPLECEILAGCDVDEMETLRNDKEYIARCQLQPMLEERDLLQRLDNVIEMQEEDGKSSAIQWKLEKLNPKRYGKAVQVGMGAPPPAPRDIPDLSKLTQEERDTLLSAITKTIGGSGV